MVLVVVAIAQLMVVLDATIVNIALPSAQHSLGFPNSDRQWVLFRKLSQAPVASIVKLRGRASAAGSEFGVWGLAT